MLEDGSMYEYYWLRDWIALISEQQINDDLKKRNEIFNRLGREGWELLPQFSTNNHFCFRRNKGKVIEKYEYHWIRSGVSLTTEADAQRDLEKRSNYFNEAAKMGWEPVLEDLTMFCFVKRK